MELLHGERNRVYLLYKLRADQSAERITAGAGDEHAAVARSNTDFGFHAIQEFQELFGLARVVTLIVVPENAVGLCVDDDGLDRGRSHVEAHAVARLVLRSAALKRVRTRSWLRCGSGRRFWGPRRRNTAFAPILHRSRGCIRTS